MRVRKLDSTGDWVFGYGDSDFISEESAILQNTTTSIKMFRNDWFLDMDLGIDWFTYIGNSNTEDLIKSAISDTVLSVDGIVGIKDIDLTLNRESRVATMNLKIITSYNKEVAQNIDVDLGAI